MAGLIYLLSFIASLTLWKYNIMPCATCTVDMTIGFLSRSWYLWGAVYYSLSCFLVFKLKKSWPTVAFLACGTIFHVFLVYYSYLINQAVCFACIGLLIAEITAIVIYLTEPKKKFDNLLAFGPGKASLIIAVVIFALSPAAALPGIEDQPKKISVAQAAYPVQPVEQTVRVAIEPIVQQDGPAFGPKIKVLTMQGSEVELDISKKPALLFSWWCSHCDHTLEDLAQCEPEDRPYLIVVYPKGNNDKDFIEQKLSSNGLPGATYYIYKHQPPIQSIPITVWWADGKLNKSDKYIPKETPKKLLGKARMEIGNNNGGKNAITAAKAIDNTVILPGNIFSFNKTVGERTPERGYLVSGVITGNGNGGFEYSQGVGGGICRISTVLHWAVKNANLEAVEHTRHSLPVEYGITKEDVAVAWPSLDYKFRNNTPNKITIKSVIGEGWIEIEIWKTG